MLEFSFGKGALISCVSCVQFLLSLCLCVSVVVFQPQRHRVKSPFKQSLVQILLPGDSFAVARVSLHVGLENLVD